jgi:hypothetical protein
LFNDFCHPDDGDAKFLRTEDSILHSHRGENLKSYKYYVVHGSENLRPYMSGGRFAFSNTVSDMKGAASDREHVHGLTQIWKKARGNVTRRHTSTKVPALKQVVPESCDISPCNVSD